MRGGCVCTGWMSQALAGHQFTANQFSPAAACAAGSGSTGEAGLRESSPLQDWAAGEGTARAGEGQRCWGESPATELQEKSVVRKEHHSRERCHGQAGIAQNLPSLEDMAGGRS